MKEGRIEVKPLLFPLNLFPVPRIEAEIAAGANVRVHFLQHFAHILIGDIAQRIARARHAVELPILPGGKIPEIAALELHGPLFFHRLFPAPLQHGFAQIGAADRNPQFLKRQRHAAGSDADVEQRPDASAAQKALPVPSGSLVSLLAFQQIVNLRAIV